MKRPALAATALVLSLAAGCAPATRPPEEVVFWQSGPPGALAPIVRRFEAENPGLRVRVEQVPPDAVAESLAVSAAAGRPPDLCELGGALMPALLASGSLSDWSAGVADQRDSLRGWEACRLGDAIYAMPWRVYPRVLYWNRELFARAGLDSARAPGTWDDLLAATARLRRLRGGVHGYGLATGDTAGLLAEFLSYAWGHGGEVLSPGADSSRFDSPGNVETLEFLVRLRRASLEGPGDALDAEFAAGRLGLRVADSRLAARLDRDAPGLRFGVAPVPRDEPGAVSPFADVSVLASHARSRHKAQALRLARYLVRPGNAAELAEALPGGMPANAGADTLEWFRGRSREAVLAAQAASARFAPRHPAWAEMERAIVDELGQALGGTKPPRLAVAEAGARVAELAGRR